MSNTEPASANVHDCQLIELPRIHDRRGDLTFIEGGRHIPFAIERVYYLYDVPGGAERGGHAHKALRSWLCLRAASDSELSLHKVGTVEEERE